jgi:hypothetical protein
LSIAYTQRATHKWKNKDEQVIFLSPPLEKSKVSFLGYFLKVWNSQRIEPFVFYMYIKIFFFRFLFSSDDIYFRVSIHV